MAQSFSEMRNMYCVAEKELHVAIALWQIYVIGSDFLYWRFLQSMNIYKCKDIKFNKNLENLA